MRISDGSSDVFSSDLQEDHVSMATNAARRLHAMVDNTATILAIEFLAACQGLEFHKPLRTSPKLEAVYAKLRTDRKTVAKGKNEEVRVSIGGMRIINKKIRKQNTKSKSITKKK